MKVTVKDNYLNVRVGAPSVNAPCYQFIAPGSQIEVDGQLYKGDLYNGIDTWMKDAAGNYYWSGGVTDNITAIDLSNKVIQWWMQQLKIPEIWSTYKEKGANAKVAIIDSGYNINNPEIKKAVVGEYVHPAFPSTITINDTYGHGTYCASLIGARNSNYIIGCAPECDLYIAKISEDDTYELNMMYDAIDWAIKQNVDIISISQGGPFDDNTCKLITTAINNNIVVVASIGNNSDTSQAKTGGKYPALCKDCLAVGATTKSNQLSLVTLVNAKTEINAPGEDIMGYITQNIPDKFPDGTSQATAIIAGVCALIISRHKALKKPYTVAGIKNLITTQYDSVINSSNQKLVSPSKVFATI